ASASASATGAAPVARSHTSVPSGCRVCASTVQPASRPLSFKRIAPASASPRATTATPIAARSQRRISALTQMPLFSRASISDGRALQPVQAFEAGDVVVAEDPHDIAVVEQHVSAVALAAAHLGNRIVRL